jgi:hypothetical protein
MLNLATVEKVKNLNDTIDKATLWSKYRLLLEKNDLIYAGSIPQAITEVKKSLILKVMANDYDDRYLSSFHLSVSISVSLSISFSHSLTITHSFPPSI